MELYDLDDSGSDVSSHSLTTNNLLYSKNINSSINITNNNFNNYHNNNNYNNNYNNYNYNNNISYNNNNNNNNKNINKNNNNELEYRKSNNKKTREELNEIEKQRTKRINSHFDSLRSLLQNSNISTKKDKFSVLKNSYDYILKLRHNICKKESEITQFCKNHISKKSEPIFSNTSTTTSSSTSASTSILNSNQYKNIFMKSSVAMAVMELNGQFIACNDNFLRLSGYTCQEFISKRIFDCIINEEKINLLNTLQSCISISSPQSIPQQILLTFEFSTNLKQIKLLLTIWIIQQKLSSDKPSYFQVMFLPISNEVENKLNTSCVSSSGDSNSTNTITITTSSSPLSSSSLSTSLLSPTGISLTASNEFLLPNPSSSDFNYFSKDFSIYHNEDKSNEIKPLIISTVTENYSSFSSPPPHLLLSNEETSLTSPSQLFLSSNSDIHNINNNITNNIQQYNHNHNNHNNSNNITYYNYETNSNNSYLLPAYSSFHPSFHQALGLTYYPSNINNNNLNNTNINIDHRNATTNNNNDNDINILENNYSHDDSDETFENIPDNWFDPDGDEEFDDDS